MQTEREHDPTSAGRFIPQLGGGGTPYLCTQKLSAARYAGEFSMVCGIAIAVASWVGEVRGAMGSHAPREPQRLRDNMRLLGGSGVGRQQGLAGAFRCCDLRAPDSELVRSEFGLIEPSAALRSGPEWHAVGPDALGECPRLIVCRAAARRAAVRPAARRRQQGEAPSGDEGCQGSRCRRPRPPSPRSDVGAGVHAASLTAGRCGPCAQGAWPAEHARPSAGAHSARRRETLHVVRRAGSRCR